MWTAVTAAAGSGWPQTSISNEFSGEADGAGLGTTL